MDMHEKLAIKVGGFRYMRFWSYVRKLLLPGPPIFLAVIGDCAWEIWVMKAQHVPCHSPSSSSQRIIAGVCFFYRRAAL